jgi:hypothetical protein
MCELSPSTEGGSPYLERRHEIGPASSMVFVRPADEAPFWGGGVGSGQTTDRRVLSTQGRSHGAWSRTTDPGLAALAGQASRLYKRCHAQSCLSCLLCLVRVLALFLLSHCSLMMVEL